MSREQYKFLLSSCEEGDVTYVRMNNTQKTNVVFFGPNLSNNFPAKNIYKALNLTKPDKVLVQMNPEILLDNFEVKP
jgi:hypothetical protein